MFLTLFKGKIHRATVTEANLNYMGSITIDSTLMRAAGILPGEKVQSVDNNNGSRLETYAIPEPFGSRRVVLNGAAARLGAVGDRIIIMSFAHVEDAVVRDGRHRPKVMRLDEKNEPVYRVARTPSAEDIASML